MIYSKPLPDELVDQGDLVDSCPILRIKEFGIDASSTQVGIEIERIIVLTQTCDLANEKVLSANVAEVFSAQQLVERGILKAADVKGPLRGGRIWGMYFLPASAELGFGEMIIDLRRLHTVRVDILRSLCQNGQRIARLQTPYREHLAKHFADTFSRIGLPQPYETL